MSSRDSPCLLAELTVGVHGPILARSALEEGEATAAKPKREPEAEPERDPFVAALNPIIDRSGGVSSLSLGKRLVALLDLARNAAQRLVVLTVCARLYRPGLAPVCGHASLLA